MSRASERDRASRKKREERDWETNEDSHVRDLEAERDWKKHRHHYDDDERRHERHRESDRRRRSVEDATLEPDLRPRNRSPDRHRDSVERRNRSRGDSPSDAVERDRDVDRRHRRSTKEDLENGGVHKHERSSNLVGKLVEREGFSHEESAERRHRKRKDYRESDEEEIENNNGKRTRVSDVEHRKSTKRVNDRDLGDVSVQSADNKVESRRENIYKDRRKERAIVMDEEMKHMQKKEKAANGSSRHDKKSRDNAELDEKLVADEENVTLRKEQRFKDEVNEEKMERSVVAKPPVSSNNSMAASQKVELADANCDGSSVFPPSSGSLANTLAEEPLIVASKVSQASSNSHSRHTKVITAINENEGVSIIRSDEVTGKSSTDGTTTSSVAGKSGSLSRDALAKAKKALQMKKELSEKLKKIPVLNKQQPSAGTHDSSHRESKYTSNSAASGPIASSISLAPFSSMPENASAAGGVKGVLSVSAASYEAVKRAQEFAKIWHHQDPDFTPLMNMFPGSSATDIGTLPKSTKVPVLRLDAQGREIDEHGNVVNKPKVTNLSTLKVNINKQKKEAFQILRPELDTDTESTFFDARMGVNKTKLMRPKRSSFQFVEEGKWSKQAEVMKIKNQFGEAQAKELKAKQSQLLKAKAEPDDNPNLIAVGERTFKEKKKDEVPEIEWWDKPFLPSGGTYNDIAEENLNLEKITIYVEHPRPIEPPAEPAPPPPQPLKLTKKEQKKLRTQRRLAKERDRQEMIRQGLIEPPKPKIKMSNLMKVLSSEATQDPTRLEKEVRAAALEREQAHMDRNIARKLTPQERREKKERKLFDDPSVPETLVSVYRINDLSHPQTRFKVDVNAQENRLTGCAVMSDGLSVVVVEGVRKSIKRYSKLMLKRINWAAAVGDDGDGGDNNNNVDETREASCPNKCVLVWQGSAAKPSFNRFFVHLCRSDAAARKVLADAGVPHYWDLAVNFSDELLWN